MSHNTPQKELKALYKQAKVACFLQKMYFYITFAFVNTIG